MKIFYVNTVIYSMNYILTKLSKCHDQISYKGKEERSVIGQQIIFFFGNILQPSQI